jgi:hypothetical protein
MKPHLFALLLFLSGVLLACTPGVLSAERIRCTVEAESLFPTAPLQEREAWWYGPHLHAAGERALCVHAQDAAEVYRFTWLRSFHPTIFIRVEQRGATRALHAKQLSGAGGLEPGSVAIDRSRPLSTDEWRRLEQLLRRAGFWDPAAAEGEPEVAGLDGAQWVVEGVREGYYHVVDLWSPDPSTKEGRYRSVGLYLLELAGLLPTDPESIY